MKISTLLLITLLIQLNGFAQFGPEQIITTELEGPDNLTIGDIDGDSFPDILIGSRFDDKISWSKNIDGTGTFGPIQFIASAETRNLSLADLDGDNDLDILAPYVFLNKFVWFENIDGLGTFGPSQIIDNDADSAFRAIGADVDGDGDLDVVGAVSMQNSAVWYENQDGLGNFSSSKLISSSLLGCRSVFPTDIDGDGDLDVVANSGDTVTISWFENLDGQGNFGPQKIVAGQALYVAEISTADIDGDGDKDIIGTTNATGIVAWHENLDGLGTFGAQQLITNQAISCSTIFCTDLENDGDIDVLFGSTPSSNEETSEVAWCENLDGLGNFGPKQVLGNTLKFTRDVYAADIDGDTDMDVFATSQNNNKVVWFENLTILGVTENQNNTIKVHPNPSSGIITIDSRNETLTQVVLYNALGKNIIETTATEQLDISALANGVYFLKLTSQRGSFVQKIVKE